MEIYVGILKVLAQKGPLKPTYITNEANVNFDVLKDYLSFLIKRGLIEESVIEKGTVVYANTPRGTNVLKFFREPDETPTNMEDREIQPAHR